MTIELCPDDLYLHLTVDDARAAQFAGCRFAHTLAGADPQDFAAALWEQELIVERAITDAGYSTEQARPAARHFGAVARSLAR